MVLWQQVVEQSHNDMIDGMECHVKPQVEELMLSEKHEELSC